jgi:hypothetical protein
VTVQDSFVELILGRRSARNKRLGHIVSRDIMITASVPLTVRAVSWRQDQNNMGTVLTLGKGHEHGRRRGQIEHIKLMTMSPSVPYQSYIFLDDRRPAAPGGSHIYRNKPIKGRSSCQRRDTGPTTRVMDALLHLLVCMTPVPGEKWRRPRLGVYRKCPCDCFTSECRYCMSMKHEFGLVYLRVACRSWHFFRSRECVSV